MKRQDLLASSYATPSMTIGGVEIVYCPLANELVRVLKSSFFNSRDRSVDQTDHAGLVEGLMVMYWIATGEKAKVWEHVEKTRDERAVAIIRFNMDFEEDIERVKPIFLQRVEAVFAASVESEAEGKHGAGAIQAPSPG
jgi:hypothetical protein